MKIEIPKSYRLKTKRFELRIPNSEDIPSVFSATKHKGFNDGMLWEPPEKEEELVEALHRNHKAWELGEGYAFTIIEKGTTKFLGRISIRKTKELNIWNVGFWTHPEVQNQGVMSESLNVIIKFGFEKLLAQRIVACYAMWNKSSEKVLKKNGMKFIRHIEKGFKKKGEWIAENLLAISKEEWSGKL